MELKTLQNHNGAHNDRAGEEYRTANGASSSGVRGL